jgi:hypothetical protein
MFEQFTDRARRVIVLDQEEARMLSHYLYWLLRASVQKPGTSRRRKISFPLFANTGGLVYNLKSSLAYSSSHNDIFT